jgi:hypothetical protein
MAVPVRATILSTVLLVPYMAVVPAMTMVYSSSVSTTGIFLVLLVQVIGILRFPLTLWATFVELSTIRKRAQQKTKAQRQNAEIEYAMKLRDQLKLQKTNKPPSEGSAELLQVC